jgi:hypothetical protein
MTTKVSSKLRSDLSPEVLEQLKSELREEIKSELKTETRPQYAATKYAVRTRSNTSQQTRDEMAKKLKIERDKDREMVKGVFKYYEVPGGMVGFCFKKYAEDPLEKFELYDNHVYTIPLGVAKHINSNTSYPVHAYTKDEKEDSSYGIPVFRIYGS